MGKTVEIVAVDDRGRVLIPRKLREKLGLSKGTKLLLAELGDTLILKKIDTEKILRAIAEEVKEKRINLDKIQHEIEEEVNILAAKKIEEILARH